MLLDATQEGNKLWVSYYDESGKTQFKIYELNKEDMYNWVVCKPNDKFTSQTITNWDGRTVKKQNAKYLNKYRIIEYIDNLPHEDLNEIFSYCNPDTYFVDIEVNVTDEFPEPSKAEEPVTAICIVTPKRQAIVLATKDLEYKTQKQIQASIDKHFKDIEFDFEFIYKKFDSEYDMMYTFMEKFVRRFPMMTGWNFVKFDWKYIINRCKRLGIDINICSPINKTFGKNEFPSHVGIMDYLDIYAKWDKTVDVKEDFRLDTVGEAVVGIRKVKYDGTIQDMYERDYPKYIFYNVIDTALVYLIHNKIKTMDIALTVAHMSKISIFKAGSPVAITESLLCREFLLDNKVMAKDFDAPQVKREQYEGAFVKEPIIGRHKAVAAFDFASLYPSIMRQMNTSPESFIKIVDPSKAHSEKSSDRIVSITGAVYSKEESVLKRILDRLYSQRREYKKLSFKYKQMAHDMENNVKK